MPEADDRPEPDRIEGAPHPREARRLFGHAAAEGVLLTGLRSGRLHHGWLLAGPRGVGKATLAWRFARAALAHPPGGGLVAPPPPTSLELPADHPVVRRVSAGAEPGLLAIRRGTDEKTGRLRTQITVDEVRRLRDFFGLSAADGGRRVVIVDAADEMNPSAANAILKLLEEPPAGALMLLVAHRPAALLPTIRSRCRMLRLGPLAPDDLAAALAQALGEAPGNPVALAELAGGSVGEAVRLVAAEGLALYARLVALMAGLPRVDRPALHALADEAAGRGAEARFDMVLRLTEVLVARLARAAATGQPPVEAAPGEAALAARLRLPAATWARLATEVPARVRAGRAVNLDPAGLLVDMVLRLEAAAREADTTGAS
jgi:DNA polymerase III subunit delta'